ncbi:lisH domain-containing protein ARMC9-like isoform X2 [Pseudomyrmex gracilis]|uniref:lisH domain-containing protein ARMC9-like isoform X2 n=1 Tax=Pseudomyrmex gracilis TaxID=219809 RepID=UPI00099560F6|nr:lisH domain-containing protein ARMC9-like isoform X2 [Pseudomyrmex gracilis]
MTELIMKNQMADNNIEIIHQFLLDHNFENTAKALIQEALKKNYQNLELKTITDPCDKLMLYYNTGNYSEFFQLWKNLFSDSIKQCEEYKKLTFYLHVHFAILPQRTLHSNGCDNKEFVEKCKENIIEIEKNINNSMKQLQDYLLGDGKELEHDTELQPFYALPFVKDLHKDTFFSTILEQFWLDELSKKLNLFITNHRQDVIEPNNVKSNEEQSQDAIQSPNISSKTQDTESHVTQNKVTKNNTSIVPNDRDIPINKIPFLEDYDDEQYNLFRRTSRNLKSKCTQTHITGDQITINGSKAGTSNVTEERLIQCNQDLALTKSHLFIIRTSYEKLKVRFHKLHADYHKLIDVAGELTVALENSVKGQAVDIQRTLEICMKIFPDLFNQNIRESYPSLLQLGYNDVKTIAMSKLDITAVPVSPKLLDYKKIKLHLLNGDVKTKLLLLQALRWKITLAQLTEQEEVLHEYINHDLLGFHGQIASNTGKPILPCLLTTGEAYARHLLQQFTARLLNTLASFRCGRDYLSIGSTIVNMIFTCLDNNHGDGIDSFACDMMVAMLQKLSLRRQQRIYMIESGLLEWLIHHLHDNCHVISLYRLEYATALLMNLSLHRLAQARASKISSLLVSTLLVLLSLDHTSSLPYINGALSNFLCNPVINEEARKVKHSDISDYLGGNHKTIELRKHLDNILRIQKRENINTPQNDETGDDDNAELDVLEHELDENDPLQNYVGELNGETLLAVCYSLSSKVSRSALTTDTTTDTTLQQKSALNSTDFYGNQHDNYLYNKHSSNATIRNSSERALTSSTTLISAHENSQTEVEKFSSIASLNYNSNNKVKDSSWKDNPELANEEDAFLSKPRISRTPP